MKVPLPPIDAHASTSPGKPSRRIERDKSVLVIVDIQTRLAPQIADGEALIDRAAALIKAARMFRIPVRATEHCPNDIGPLIDRLRDTLEPHELFAKTRFGAVDHPEFAASLGHASRSQIVIAGMEAHVCVMQTALGLVAVGYEVFVVADAVGSRSVRPTDRTLALARMQDAGCTLVGTETLLFEWTGAGDDPAFRAVLALVKALP